MALGKYKRKVAKRNNKDLECFLTFPMDLTLRFDKGHFLICQTGFVAGSSDSFCGINIIPVRMRMFLRPDPTGKQINIRTATLSFNSFVRMNKTYKKQQNNYAP